MTDTAAFTCPQGCSGSWPLESGFRAHLKARHRMDDAEIDAAVAVGTTTSIGGDVFECDLCDRTCNTERGLAIHLGRDHKSGAKKPAKRSGPKSKPVATKRVARAPRTPRLDVEVTLEHRWSAFCLLNGYSPAAELDRLREEIISTDEGQGDVDQLAGLLACREARA